MKRLAGLSALALIISSTSGCGWVWGPEGYFRDRGSDYLEAQQTAPMQLPPDITTAKRLDPLLPIPRNVADDTAKGEYIVPRPQPLSAVADASDCVVVGAFSDKTFSPSGTALDAAAGNWSEVAAQRPGWWAALQAWQLTLSGLLAKAQSSPALKALADDTFWQATQAQHAALDQCLREPQDGAQAQALAQAPSTTLPCPGPTAWSTPYRNPSHARLATAQGSFAFSARTPPANTD